MSNGVAQALTRVKTAAKLRFPHLYEAIKAQRPATRRRKRSLNARSAEDIFAEIYDTNAWRSSESKSGLGSTLAATTEIRAALPNLLTDLGIRVLIDAPCGDFNWMQHVDLPVDEYIGGDIVSQMIDHLNAEYANENRSFMVLDLTKDELPKGDALFARDLLLHLSFADIERVKANFLRSECKYLITSNYPNVRVQFDILTGEARPVNLLRPPVNWPAPIRVVNDRAGEAMDRVMGVWHRDQF
jgi:hypothetical protein